MSLEFSDFTFIVQGPLSSVGDRSQDEDSPTRAINSIRVHFPGAKIIVTTWKSDKAEPLRALATVIENEDPGPAHSNLLRQVVSVQAALKHADTVFTVKSRVDYVFTSAKLLRRFLKTQEEKRVLTISNFSKIPSMRFPFPMHFSDNIQVGKTEDIKALWNPRLEETSQKLSELFNGARAPYHLHNEVFEKNKSLAAPEQILWASYFLYVLEQEPTLLKPSSRIFTDHTANRILLRKHIVVVNQSALDAHCRKHDQMGVPWKNWIRQYGEIESNYKFFWFYPFKRVLLAISDVVGIFLFFVRQKLTNIGAKI